MSVLMLFSLLPQNDRESCKKCRRGGGERHETWPFLVFFTQRKLTRTAYCLQVPAQRGGPPGLHICPTEDPGSVSYSEIGGLSEQIRELREVQPQAQPPFCGCFVTAWALLTDFISRTGGPIWLVVLMGSHFCLFGCKLEQPFLLKLSYEVSFKYFVLNEPSFLQTVFHRIFFEHCDWLWDVKGVSAVPGDRVAPDQPGAFPESGYHPPEGLSAVWAPRWLECRLCVFFCSPALSTFCLLWRL